MITPVFEAGGPDILFFVANRGHHADIGGITPGSTPPVSRILEEEGVVLDNFLLVDAGEFREAEFRRLLASATYPLGRLRKGGGAAGIWGNKPMHPNYMSSSARLARDIRITAANARLSAMASAE